MPIVVSAPWPGSTIVSAGNVNSLSSIELDDRGEVAALELGAPGPPGNSVSPVNSRGVPSTRERDRARRVAGVVDRVQPQPSDLDHLGVVEEHVVADVFQHRGVERR